MPNWLELKIKIKQIKEKLTIKNRVSLLLMLSLVIVGLVLSVHPVHAEGAIFDGTIGWLVDGILTAVSWLMLALARIAIALSVFFLKFFIELAGYNGYIDAPTVIVGWVMIRDVANMFFVVVLLAIAIGTILGIEAYEWKKTLVKFVLAAVFINFSKMICGLIIDIAHILTTTFINAIAAAAGGNLISMFKLDAIYKMVGANNFEKDTISIEVLIATITSSFFAVWVCLTIGAYTIVMLARVVVLWALIILSPLAFIMQVIPQTQGYAKQWWEKFGKQVMVAPVMVFFLWLAFATLGNGDINSHLKQYTIPGGGVSNTNEQIFSSTQGQLLAGNEINKVSISEVSTWENMASLLVAIAFLSIGVGVVQQMGVVGGGLIQSAQNFAKKAITIASGYALGRKLAGGAWRGVKKGGKSLAKDVLMNMPGGGRMWKRGFSTFNDFRKSNKFLKHVPLIGGFREEYNDKMDRRLKKRVDYNKETRQAEMSNEDIRKELWSERLSDGVKNLTGGAVRWGLKYRGDTKNEAEALHARVMGQKGKKAEARKEKANTRYQNYAKIMLEVFSKEEETHLQKALQNWHAAGNEGTKEDFLKSEDSEGFIKDQEQRFFDFQERVHDTSGLKGMDTVDKDGNIVEAKAFMDDQGNVLGEAQRLGVSNTMREAYFTASANRYKEKSAEAQSAAQKLFTGTAVGTKMAQEEAIARQGKTIAEDFKKGIMGTTVELEAKKAEEKLKKIKLLPPDQQKDALHHLLGTDKMAASVYYKHESEAAEKESKAALGESGRVIDEIEGSSWKRHADTKREISDANADESIDIDKNLDLKRQERQRLEQRATLSEREAREDVKNELKTELAGVTSELTELADLKKRKSAKHGRLTPEQIAEEAEIKARKVDAQTLTADESRDLAELERTANSVGHDKLSEFEKEQLLELRKKKTGVDLTSEEEARLAELDEIRNPKKLTDVEKARLNQLKLKKGENLTKEREIEIKIKGVGNLDMSKKSEDDRARIAKLLEEEEDLIAESEVLKSGGMGRNAVGIFTNKKAVADADVARFSTEAIIAKRADDTTKVKELQDKENRAIQESKYYKEVLDSKGKMGAPEEMTQHMRMAGADTLSKATEDYFRGVKRNSVRYQAAAEGLGDIRKRVDLAQSELDDLDNNGKNFQQLHSVAQAKKDSALAEQKTMLENDPYAASMYYEHTAKTIEAETARYKSDVNVEMIQTGMANKFLDRLADAEVGGKLAEDFIKGLKNSHLEKMYKGADEQMRSWLSLSVEDLKKKTKEEMSKVGGNVYVRTLGQAQLTKTTEESSGIRRRQAEDAAKDSFVHKIRYGTVSPSSALSDYSDSKIKEYSKLDRAAAARRATEVLVHLRNQQRLSGGKDLDIDQQAQMNAANTLLSREGWIDDMADFSVRQFQKLKDGKMTGEEKTSWEGMAADFADTGLIQVERDNRGELVRDENKNIKIGNIVTAYDRRYAATLQGLMSTGGDIGLMSFHNRVSEKMAQQEAGIKDKRKEFEDAAIVDYLNDETQRNHVIASVDKKISKGLVKSEDRDVAIIDEVRSSKGFNTQVESSMKAKGIEIKKYFDIAKDIFEEMGKNVTGTAELGRWGMHGVEDLKARYGKYQDFLQDATKELKKAALDTGHVELGYNEDFDDDHNLYRFTSTGEGDKLMYYERVKHDTQKLLANDQFHSYGDVDLRTGTLDDLNLLTARTTIGRLNKQIEAAHINLRVAEGVFLTHKDEGGCKTVVDEKDRKKYLQVAPGVAKQKLINDGDTTIEQQRAHIYVRDMMTLLFAGGNGKGMAVIANKATNGQHTTAEEIDRGTIRIDVIGDRKETAQQLAQHLLDKFNDESSEGDEYRRQLTLSKEYKNKDIKEIKDDLQKIVDAWKVGGNSGQSTTDTSDQDLFGTGAV